MQYRQSSIPHHSLSRPIFFLCTLHTSLLSSVWVCVWVIYASKQVAATFSHYFRFGALSCVATATTAITPLPSLAIVIVCAYFISRRAVFWKFHKQKYHHSNNSLTHSLDNDLKKRKTTTKFQVEMKKAKCRQKKTSRFLFSRWYVLLLYSNLFARLIHSFLMYIRIYVYTIL